MKIVASINPVDRPVLVDVGANIGLFTKLLCESFVRADIHCFEPGSEMMGWLRRETSYSCTDSKVSFYSNAVGDKHGAHAVLYGPTKQKMYTATNLKPHNTGASISTGVNERRGSTVILGRTTTVRLDKVFASTPRIELVKIDAEGFDPFVLRGLQLKLQQQAVQLLYWEFNKHWSVASVHRYSQVVSWLAEFEFTSYVVGKRQLIQISHDCLNTSLLDQVQDTHNVLSILKTSSYATIPLVFAESMLL